MSRWFRVYDDMLDDPKVQRLDPVLFKTWINLLCLASRGGGRLPSIDDITFALRCDEETTITRIQDLTAKGLLDESDNTLRPHNWDKRQFASDNSTERSRKHREANGATSPQRECNVAATPPEAETEAETERKVLSETSSDPSPPKRKRADYPTDFEDFWRAYPTDQNMSKVETFKAWGKLDEADRKLAFEAVAPFRAWVAKQKDYRVLHAVRFLSQRRFDGFSGATSPAASPVAAPQGFYVTYGTDAGDAWDAHFKTTKGISAPRDARGGWWHKTEWPPEHHSEAA